MSKKNKNKIKFFLLKKIVLFFKAVIKNNIEIIKSDELTIKLPNNKLIGKNNIT